MTRIHTRSRVKPDGTVVVPVGTAEAGRDVIVTVQPAPPEITGDEWRQAMRTTAGSINDPSFVAPVDTPPRRAPDLDK
jgi:hypothetical protein